MTDPLVIEVEIDSDVDHAFSVWTDRAATWWPVDHTMTGAAGVAIVFEPRVDGRIFERAPDGTEHTWGTITVWEPPRELAYTWHLGQDPEVPTEVSVGFHPLGDRCRVRIEHTGWERLGMDATTRRRANRAGWDATLPRFVASASAR